MEEVQITKAELVDAEAIARLVNQAYRPAEGGEGWTHESELVSGIRVDVEAVLLAIQSSRVLVGSIGQEPVGCVQIEMKGNAAHIGMLAVDPSRQAGGIGKLLLERAEQFAVLEKGAEFALLAVITERTELIEFYIRRGYSPTGEQLPYPVDTGVGVPVKEAMPLVVLKKVFQYESKTENM